MKSTFFQGFSAIEMTVILGIAAILLAITTIAINM